MDVPEPFNVVVIVEGKRIRPTLSNTPTKAEIYAPDAWMKSATQAKIVLSQCISDELHQRISGRLSAKEAWDVLTQEFDNKAEDQLFRACLKFFNMEWFEKEDAPTVLAHIKNQHRNFSAGLKIH